ncbi:Lrp/AsnC family transcriptional regulator [Nanoarchaeota archaeon]
MKKFIPGRMKIPEKLPEIKLTKADQRIIAEMVKNGRISASSLAKKIGLSKEATIYRIKRLEKLDVISEYRTKVDVIPLGYRPNMVFFQTNLNPKEKEKIYDYLIEHPWVNWVSTATGKWDLLTYVMARNLNHLDRILDEISRKIKPITYSVFSITEYLGECLDFFELEGGFKSRPKRKTKHKVDKYDVEILNELIKNGRAPFVKVAKKVGLSRDSVKRRVTKLKQEGIIDFFYSSIHTPLLGHHWHAVIVKMVDPDKEKEFINYILNNTMNNAFFKTIGEFDFYIEVNVKSSLEFYHFITDMMSKFGKSIINYHEMLQFGQEYFTWFPEGVYKDLLKKV